LKKDFVISEAQNQQLAFLELQKIFISLYAIVIETAQFCYPFS